MSPKEPSPLLSLFALLFLHAVGGDVPAGDALAFIRKGKHVRTDVCPICGGEIGVYENSVAHRRPACAAWESATSPEEFWDVAIRYRTWRTTGQRARA